MVMKMTNMLLKVPRNSARQYRIAKKVLFLGAGHIPQITHVEAYTEALSDFLQDLDLIH